MPDWKETYLSLMRDTEAAIRILEEGQRKCEEMYLRDDGPSLLLFSPQEPSTQSKAESSATEAEGHT